MIVTHKIKMDLTNRGITPVVDVMQDDQYSRNLEIGLYTGHEEFTLPEDCTVLVRYKKSDGRGGLYDTMPDGTCAWSVSGNVVTVALAPQVCTAPGSVAMSVALLSGGHQLNSFEICLKVGACPQGNYESVRYINLANCLPQIVNASAGQFLKVASVDELGKVTGLTAEEVSTTGSGIGLIVNATPIDDSYVLDCTLQQIKEAYAAQQLVYCRVGDDRLLPLTMVTEEYCLFAGVGIVDDGMGVVVLLDVESAELTGAFVMEQELATADMIPEVPSRLANPWSLYLKGAVTAEYSGISAVTVTLPICVPVPTKAAVGQVMMVSVVDANGAPTAWIPVDPLVVKSSGGSKYKIIVDDSGNLSTQAVS